MKTTAITARDQLLGLTLCVAYLGLLVATAPELGLSRDESIYLYAAERYADYLEGALHDPAKAFERQFIDQHYQVNHEHPGLIKGLFALSSLLERHYGLFGSLTLAHRFPAMVCASVLLWLLYVMGTGYAGRPAGLFAALAYALLPRPFYHAHLNCFDVPIVLAITATVHAYSSTLRSPRQLWRLGLVFGAALATKHNSWVLPALFAIHFVWLQCNQRWHRHAVVPPHPYFLAAMLLIGPCVLVATWPWLWHDGWTRFLWYARFHLRHEYYNMAYFGVNYFRPPFPFSYPWMMTLITVPLTTLLLGAGGLWCESTAILSHLRRRLPRDPEERAVLWLGAMLAPLLMIALPSTPIFGGTKHWFPAYPFMCLFAGIGFQQLLATARKSLPEHWTTRSQRLLPAGLTLGLLLPSAVETAHSHRFGLSHYTPIAGGVPGAADLGMNRQFWGFTAGSLERFFRTALPNGGKVHVCDMTHLAFHMLGREGHLPSGVEPTAHLRDADYALVHHEHHFADMDFQIWTTYGTVQPVAVLSYDGVPILSVYRNPRGQTH